MRWWCAGGGVRGEPVWGGDGHEHWHVKCYVTCHPYPLDGAETAAWLTATTASSRSRDEQRAFHREARVSDYTCDTVKK